MLARSLACSVAALLLAAVPALAADEYSIKEVEAAPPKEVAPPVAELLGKKSVQLLDAKGEALCQVWFRKEVPSPATAAQVKNGLTYQELQETTVLGVLQILKPMTDYRKQKIKPGVFTLRLGFQPSDGDHMGTAPYKEFCLLVPADEDKNPAPMKDAKELQEASTKATGTSHPGVFLLMPVKDAGDTAKLVSMPNNHWVLTWKQAIMAKDSKGTLNIGLTLIGVSAAA